MNKSAVNPSPPAFIMVALFLVALLLYALSNLVMLVPHVIGRIWAHIDAEHRDLWREWQGRFRVFRYSSDYENYGDATAIYASMYFDAQERYHWRIGRFGWLRRCLQRGISPAKLRTITCLLS